MDEEDGRLGPTPGHIIGNRIVRYPPLNVTDLRARQIGRVDVLTDALAKSLCHSHSHLQSLGAPSLDFETWGRIPFLKRPTPFRGKP